MFSSLLDDLTPLALPLPSGTSRHVIANGTRGTEQTITLMQKLVNSGKRNNDIRQLCGQVIQKCQTKDYYCYAKACYEWVRDNIKYAYDPHLVEYLESAETILQNKIGDCDSMDILLCSMFEHLGMEAEFVTIKADASRPDEFTHVYTRVNVPKVGWISADPIMPDKTFGWEAPYPNGKRYWHASADELDQPVDTSDSVGGDMSNLSGLGATKKQQLRYDIMEARLAQQQVRGQRRADMYAAKHGVTTPSSSAPTVTAGPYQGYAPPPGAIPLNLTGLGHGGHGGGGRGWRGGGWGYGGPGYWGGGFDDNVYVLPVIIPSTDAVSVVPSENILLQQAQTSDQSHGVGLLGLASLADAAPQLSDTATQSWLTRIISGSFAQEFTTRRNVIQDRIDKAGKAITAAQKLPVNDQSKAKIIAAANALKQAAFQENYALNDVANKYNEARAFIGGATGDKWNIPALNGLGVSQAFAYLGVGIAVSAALVTAIYWVSTTWDHATVLNSQTANRELDLKQQVINDPSASPQQKQQLLNEINTPRSDLTTIIGSFGTSALKIGGVAIGAYAIYRVLDAVLTPKRASTPATA